MAEPRPPIPPRALGAALRITPWLVSAFVLALLSTTSLDAAEAPHFEEKAEALGLDFQHFNGMSGKRYFPEMTGQGIAVIDYDRDGDYDVYCVQGAFLAGESMSDVTFPVDGPLSDRLFQNRLIEDGTLHFVDVTSEVGLAATAYGMGVAVGDYDDDGWPDLYLANYGANQLWRNVEGRFEDVTARSGAQDETWSTAASFVDLNSDGNLDLYVVNYVEYSLKDNPTCYASSSRPDYCGPSSFPPLPDRIFLGDDKGNLTLYDSPSVRQALLGPGLGSLTIDANADGRLDLYVANDGAANVLLLNTADGLIEDALIAGLAVNREGAPEASMGLDAGDADGDGDEDIFVAHLDGETNTVYRNLGDGFYEDATIAFGLSAGSVSSTAFGAVWIDDNADGWLDLAVVNGAVRIVEAQVPDPYPLKQPNQYFRNLGGGKFVEMSDAMPAPYRELLVSRGLADVDLDNDGDRDLLVANNQGPLQVFVNRHDPSSWRGLSIQRESGSPALGATVRATLADGRELLQRVRTDGSYASARDDRVLLGGESSITRLEIVRPGAAAVQVPVPQENGYVAITP